MDEAVVRIILQDGTGTSTSSTDPLPSSPTSSSPTGGTHQQPQNRSHPAPSPSPPPAGTLRPGTQGERNWYSPGSQWTSPHTPQSSTSTTTTQTRPSWVNDLIEGISKNVKQLSMQLSGGRLTPPTTGATGQAGGMPQLLQPLQNIQQTSIPPLNTTSVVPSAGQGPPPPYSAPPPPTPPVPPPPSPVYVAPPQTQPATYGGRTFQSYSEASKRGAATARKNKADKDAKLRSHRQRMAEALGGSGAEVEDDPAPTKRRKKRVTKAAASAARAEIDESQRRNELDVSQPTGIPDDFGTKLYAEGGELPRMAGGGELPHLASGSKYPIAEPFSPPPKGWGQVEGPKSRLDVLGPEGKVKFTDPLSQLSDKDLLNTYKNNQPVPVPGNLPVPLKFAQDWYVASRLMPDAASKIKSVEVLTKEELAEYKKRGRNPTASINPKTGQFKIGSPEGIDASVILHELIHAEQHERGDFYKEPLYEESGGLTSHGRLMESEAYQRGNEQGAEVVDRVRSLMQKDKKGDWWMDHQSGGGELPRFAKGGFFSKMFGQKEQPPSYNAATWMANNRAIDSLRNALGTAGYSAKDASTLASNKDILGMWKAGWSLADLRRTNLLPYDPYDSDDIEIIGDKKPSISPNAEVSIPQAPPPPLPGVRVTKKGEIITARKGKSKRPVTEEFETEESSDAEKPLPLTRKRPKPFFVDGGELPHYAGGGAIVGDLPGQSLASIESDPHTEVIKDGRVYSHQQALKGNMFRGGGPRYATGFPQGFGPPPTPPRRGRLRGGSYGRRNKKIGQINKGAFVSAAKAGKALGIPGSRAASKIANAGSMSASLGMGPAGAIIEAVKMATAAAIGTNKAVIGGAGAVANWAAGADADPGKTIAGLGDAASKAGEEISKVSPVLGVMINAFGEAGKALGSFMQELDKTAQRYAEVNPAIAQQQAIGEIRQVMGDMRRGQEIAPEMVRYMQTQQDLQQKFEDIKIKALNQILKVVNPILEILERILPEGEAVEDAIRGLLAPLEMLANMAAAMFNIQRDDHMPVVQDPADILLDQGREHIGNRNNFNRGVGF